MDPDVKLYIKPGIFEAQSKLNDYSTSYKGLHSEESLSYSEEIVEENNSLSENNNSNNSLSHSSSYNDIKTNEEIPNKNSTEVKFTFIWDEGGKNVKVTGSFVNWASQFDMVYNQEEKVFKYEVTLSKSKHLFKFIVDGIWKCSQKYPQMRDNSNNSNNFVDLTYFSMSKKIESPKKKVKKKKKKPKEKKEKKIIKRKKDRGYGIQFPTKDDLNMEAPVVQQDYLDTFLIDKHTNQNFIGRSQYLEYKTIEPFTEEKSYKELMMAPHISINHSLKSVEKLDLLETGMNFRFRDKNCTLVYYTHQNK